MRSLMKHVLLLGNQGAATETLDSYLLSLEMPLLLLLNEDADAETAINYGTSGATLNATISGATPALPGPTGRAYSFDGSNDYLLIANNAVLAQMTTQRWAFLVNLDSLGVSDRGNLFNWGAFSANRHWFRTNSTNRLDVAIYTSATAALAITNNNQADALIGDFNWVFMDYDDANTLGNGRRIRLFIGNGSGLAQLTLATDQAATGTVRNMDQNLYIANEGGTLRAFDGLMACVAAGPGLWSNEEMQHILDLTPE